MPIEDFINPFEKWKRVYCLYIKQVEKIILFGSHAHGVPSEESDIDIVIISKDFKNKDIFQRVNLTMETEVEPIQKFMIPFDIITMTPEELESETSLITDYAKKGKILYAA